MSSGLLMSSIFLKAPSIKAKLVIYRIGSLRRLSSSWKKYLIGD